MRGRVLFGFALLVATGVATLLAGCAGPDRGRVGGAGTGSALASAPILRLDTHMHTAAITRVAVDWAGQHILTASKDKTARLWRARDGALLEVFRPPIGTGHEGELYAAALSPDGTRVAVAGWTTAGTGNASVYLFDAESGRLARRFGGLPSAVYALAFSPDGTHLAAGLGGPHGVRMWRLPGAERVLTDDRYQGGVYGLAFGPAGRLAASANDGDIRVYTPDGAHRRRVPAPDGRVPYGIAFHPDGARLAVGYRDSPAVSVLDTATLARAYRVDTDGLDNGGLNRVAWSTDGNTLYAAGKYRGESGQPPVLRWRDGGRGARTALPGPNVTVMDLAALPQGGVVYGSDAPVLARVQPDGAERWRRQAPIADMRGKLGRAFRVSPDGRKVWLGLEAGDGDPVLVDLAARSVRPTATPPAGVHAPATGGVPVAAWQNSRAPRLDGETLPLAAAEWSRSLAGAPGNDRFLLGASWSLRLFDAHGEQLWRRDLPAEAWGVNIPRGGRVAVAALGDGTLRWYRLDDGALLLSMFVHAETREWVAWTPSGYYAASRDGETHLGWHVNRGKAAASAFHPAGRFRDRYRAPEVVTRILRTLNEAQAVRRAGTRAAPADAAGRAASR